MWKLRSTFRSIFLFFAMVVYASFLFASWKCVRAPKRFWLTLKKLPKTYNGNLQWLTASSSKSKSKSIFSSKRLTARSIIVLRAIVISSLLMFVSHVQNVPVLGFEVTRCAVLVCRFSMLKCEKSQKNMPPSNLQYKHLGNSTARHMYSWCCSALILVPRKKQRTLAWRLE